MKRVIKGFVFFAGVLVGSQSAWAMDSTGLTIERRMLFNAWTFFPQGSYYDANWTHVGPAPSSFLAGIKMLLPGTNHAHSAGWRLTACRAGTSAGVVRNASFIPPLAYVAPSVPTNWQASLQNTLDAKIETPFYSDGVGTLYFDAINADPDFPTEITVEIATNMIGYTCLGGQPTNVMFEAEGERDGGVFSNDWRTLSVLLLAAASSNDFTRYQQRLNCRQAARFRIRRTDTVYPVYANYYHADVAFTAVDNLCISLPPSDVVIRDPEKIRSSGTDILLRCRVDNAATNEYARTTFATRTVKAFYRWRYLNQETGPWQTNVMAYVSGTGDGLGNGERYEVSLSAQTEGWSLEYGLVCDFEGYRYRNIDFTQTGYAYETEWLSPWTLIPPPCATTTTPVPVPHAWLDQNPALLSLAGYDYEMAAQADVDGDGQAAWQEYLAGSLPTNTESVLRTLLSVSNGLTRLAWSPDLGTARVYEVTGRTNLTHGAWGPTNSGSRFFRVKARMP